MKKIAVESRENIEKISLELFALRGYHATFTALFAEKTDISKGLQYNYHKNKEQTGQIIIQTINHLKENRTF